MDSRELAAELAMLNKYRQIAVAVAIGLLILSLVSPNFGFAMARSAAWAVAGAMSLRFASKAKEAGYPASYTNAVIYFAVAIVPLVKGR
jgi:hypothetical protein